MKSFVFVTLAAFLTLCQCGVITESQETEIAPYSIIDSIIKSILESMRPKLANLKLDNINETISQPNLKASVLVKDIMIKNADKFVIRNLNSQMVPLQLTNLTLTWKNIAASAAYDIDAKVSLSNTSSPVRLFAKGNATADLNDLFFTIGANFELKNKVIQIKPKGLFGFDLIIKRVNVTLTSILGNSDIGKTVSVFLSQIIPQIVDTMKKPLFNAYQEDIIKTINQILKKNKITFLDEELAFENAPSLKTLELSKEIDSFSGDYVFDSSEENNFKLNF